MLQSNAAKNVTNKILIKESKIGYDFDVFGDVGRFDYSIKLNWRQYDFLSDELLSSYKEALSYIAEELSANYCHQIFKNLLSFFRKQDSLTIDLQSIINYRSSLNDDQEHYLGSLRAFLVSWYHWEIPGVPADVVKFMEEITLKGFVKGKAVAKGCPYSGAFTMSEQQAILTWAVNAYIKKEINTKEYSYLLTLLYTGRRPVQIRNLAQKDLCNRQSSDHNYQYFVNIPRAKQRGKSFRESFNEIEIDEDLYLLLNQQSIETLELFENQLGNRLSKELTKELPIFAESNIQQEFNTEKDIQERILKTADYLFLNANNATSLMYELAKKCKARSERLVGEYIHLNAYRFRYTKGTNMSRRGIKGIFLAEALDHSDTQNLKVYTENTHEDVELIDKAMSKALSPLAQAFAGTLVESEKDAVRGNDPHSRIRFNTGKASGSCGNQGFCASGVNACYTCIHFQPWLEAPHSEYLETILEEREVQKKAGVSKFVIQSTDRLAMAIQQVFQMCVDFRSQRETTKSIAAQGDKLI
ncbi:MAG: tyrosine-type recombinase/integrase [Bacteroidales bacterium]|jgi:integrase|nr:tyrosine-type recombinase/integrase [Bacteroidales bacterium]